MTDAAIISHHCIHIKFGLIDAVGASYVASFTQRYEASYLAGVFAALWSETGKIGFIGGMDSPVIERFEAGSGQVRAANPNAEGLAGGQLQ